MYRLFWASSTRQNLPAGERKLALLMSKSPRRRADTSLSHQSSDVSTSPFPAQSGGNRGIPYQSQDILVLNVRPVRIILISGRKRRAKPVRVLSAATCLGPVRPRLADVRLIKGKEGYALQLVRNPDHESTALLPEPVSVDAGSGSEPIRDLEHHLLATGFKGWAGGISAYTCSYVLAAVKTHRGPNMPGTGSRTHR